MSNSTTGKIWKIDTPGILSTEAVMIKHLVFEHNGSGDAFKLTYHDPSTVISAGCDESFSESHTGKIEGNDTMTMDGGSLLPNTIVDGAVFEILRSTGDADNIGVKTLVKTAGTNTVVVVWDDPWDNDTTGKDYSWKTYTSYDVMRVLAGMRGTIHLPLDGNGEGYKVPNLACEELASDCHLYILT